MNRLWIRMQSGKSRNREKREAERQDLKVLVGSNFACLSQLDTIDAEYYKTVGTAIRRHVSASSPRW